MKDKNQTLLWQIEGAGLPGPSFLFGTMHVRDRRAFRLLEPVLDRLEQVEALATEFNLQEMDAQVDPQRLLLPGGMTLPQLIGDKKYEKLRRIIRKSIGIDIHPLRHHKPILIVNLVDERILARDMPLALDQHLFLTAEQRGKRLLGIETYLEQLEILQRIPLSDQISGLLALGRHIGRHRRHLLRMTELYEQQNIRMLYQSARRGAQGLRQLMLYRRNALMAERIGPMLHQQTTIVAIGAGHLAGGKGVLRLLKQQGFKLIPLK